MPRTIQGKDINRRSVLASVEVGIGREGFATVCEILNMPPPVSVTSWTAHVRELHNQHLVAAEEFLNKNREEVKDFY